LTSIPLRIHCPATTNWVGGKDELDEIAVEHFLDTLARVALAVASRKLRSQLADGLDQDQPGGEVDP
jgi:hypothetical protein